MIDLTSRLVLVRSGIKFFSTCQVQVHLTGFREMIFFNLTGASPPDRFSGNDFFQPDRCKSTWQVTLCTCQVGYYVISVCQE
jgi:hypothetical protein